MSSGAISANHTPGSGEEIGVGGGSAGGAGGEQAALGREIVVKYLP